MKNLKTNLTIILSLFFILTFTMQAMISEIRVRVNNGSSAKLIEVFAYSSLSGGYLLFDYGYSVVDTDTNHFQAKCDVGDSNTSGATWQPLSYNRAYYIKIDGNYCRLSIGSQAGTPDFDLQYSYGTFSEITEVPKNIIKIEAQGQWNAKDITVKNSFNAGNVKIDGTLYSNIGSSGETKTFGSPTFPHKLEAIDNQSSGGFTEKFQNWKKNGASESTNLALSISATTATYQATFATQYNLTFQNSFVGGTIKVDGSTVSSPTGTCTFSDVDVVPFEALNQTVNGIVYTFDQWQDSNTSASRTITPTGNTNYTANFDCKPVSVGNSLTFNSGADGTPVILYWDDNVNSSVQYKIYRKVGKFGSTTLIATKNSGVETYTDYDMVHTSNTSTDNLTSYDVRAYYPTESTSADEDFSTLYAELLPKQINEEEIASNEHQVIEEYALNSNYPNPFNPTTQISYQIPENSLVNLVVYNALGQAVAELVNQHQASGQYSVQFNAANLPSGVYIYKLQAGNFSSTKKMVLTK